MSKAIKLLLTELVGQCRKIWSLDFSAFTSHTGKNAGNVSALTSHSVNITKSIKLFSRNALNI